MLDRSKFFILQIMFFSVVASFSPPNDPMSTNVKQYFALSILFEATSMYASSINKSASLLSFYLSNRLYNFGAILTDTNLKMGLSLSYLKKYSLSWTHSSWVSVWNAPNSFLICKNFLTQNLCFLFSWRSLTLFSNTIAKKQLACNVRKMCDRCTEWKPHDARIAEHCWSRVCGIAALPGILPIKWNPGFRQHLIQISMTKMYFYHPRRSFQMKEISWN